MRGVVQRVRSASVAVEGEPTRSIAQGLVLLVGVAREDGENDARWLAEKCAHLRIFPDRDGKMNCSLLDTLGGVLVVSQFTLLGDARKGRRPSFTLAAPAEIADSLCRGVADHLRTLGVSPVAEGTFQAHMVVSLENDGPVTILLDSAGSAA